MMTVLQIVLTKYDRENTKSFYFTFVITLIIIFLLALSAIAGSK